MQSSVEIGDGILDGGATEDVVYIEQCIDKNDDNYLWKHKETGEISENISNSEMIGNF